MGCDIFSWVEVLDPASKRWTVVRNAFPADAIENKLWGVDFMSAPFRDRIYGLFGFLADVRNYSHCEPLDQPRGLPDDCDASGGCAVIDEHDWVEELHVHGADSLLKDFHSHSWFRLSELLDFDYDKVFWNRRVRGGGIHGPMLAEEGQGVYLSYREFLGATSYFQTLEIMKDLGPPDRVRVVFCFGD